MRKGNKGKNEILEVPVQDDSGRYTVELKIGIGIGIGIRIGIRIEIGIGLGLGCVL